jgi:hypothetical protein
VISIVDDGGDGNDRPETEKAVVVVLWNVRYPSLPNA